MQKRNTLRIAIACGGTGGHVFPGLATADRLKKLGHEVILFVAGRSEEQSALGGWQGSAIVVRDIGVFLPLLPRNARAMLGIVPAITHCLKTMKRFQADVLLAMGSYASVAPVLAAKLLRAPVVLHEANVVPGRAVRFLSPFADVMAVGFEETSRLLKHRRLVTTGMPIRDSVRGESVAASLAALSDTAFTVLAMGGSRGAHKLNMAVSGAICLLRARGMNVQVIHLAGGADEAIVRDRYQSSGAPNAVFAFLRAVDQAYARASFAVCRAGASTCAELARYAMPALLVPFPFAVRRHQLANARVLEKSGAADVIEENEIDEKRMADYLAAVMSDVGRLDRMRQAARARYRGDAAAALADLVVLVGRESCAAG